MQTPKLGSKAEAKGINGQISAERRVCQLLRLLVEFIACAAVVGNWQTDGRRHQRRPLAAFSAAQLRIHAPRDPPPLQPQDFVIKLLLSSLVCARRSGSTLCKFQTRSS